MFLNQQILNLMLVDHTKCLFENSDPLFETKFYSLHHIVCTALVFNKISLLYRCTLLYKNMPTSCIIGKYTKKSFGYFWQNLLLLQLIRMLVISNDSQNTALSYIFETIFIFKEFELEIRQIRQEF